MFGKAQIDKTLASVPIGISELRLCVVDAKGKIRYRLSGNEAEADQTDPFPILKDLTRGSDIPWLQQLLKEQQAASLSFCCGGELKKSLFILPYQKRKKWMSACLEVVSTFSDPVEEEDPSLCGLTRNQICLLVLDPNRRICSVNSHLPESLGYQAGDLIGVDIRDLFVPGDFDPVEEAPPDTGVSIKGVKLYTLAGSRRDVEVKKLSLPDHFMLYSLCDVSPDEHAEELSAAITRERQRIGQDMHDSIGQTLTGMSLLSRSLATQLQRDAHPGSDDASQISELADVSSNQIRQISRGLMPSEVMRNGLANSLEELAFVTTRSCAVVCTVQIDEAIELMDIAVETHLYRIAQEAVNNAVRHSAAEQIRIVLSQDDGLLQLEVVDDGCWVEPEANVIGIGLRTMEYRAAAVGGQLQIRTADAGGTSVSCQIDMGTSVK